MGSITRQQIEDTAKLIGSDKMLLTFSEIQGINLSELELPGITFNDSLMQSSNLSHGNFSKAKLEYVELNGAMLDYANFSDATFFHADLRNTKLRNVNFTSTYFGQADLRGADFSGADLTKANLHFTDLRGANLREAKLSETHFRFANYNGDTIWPLGFDPRLVGAEWKR